MHDASFSRSFAASVGIWKITVVLFCPQAAAVLLLSCSWAGNPLELHVDVIDHAIVTKTLSIEGVQRLSGLVAVV